MTTLQQQLEACGDHEEARRITLELGRLSDRLASTPELRRPAMLRRIAALAAERKALMERGGK